MSLRQDPGKRILVSWVASRWKVTRIINYNEYHMALA